MLNQYARNKYTKLWEQWLSTPNIHFQPLDGGIELCMNSGYPHSEASEESLSLRLLVSTRPR